MISLHAVLCYGELANPVGLGISPRDHAHFSTDAKAERRSISFRIPFRLSLLVAQDVAVTSIQDGHGRAAEELTACHAKIYLR